MRDLDSNTMVERKTLLIDSITGSALSYILFKYVDPRIVRDVVAFTVCEMMTHMDEIVAASKEAKDD